MSHNLLKSVKRFSRFLEITIEKSRFEKNVIKKNAGRKKNEFFSM